MCVWRTLHLILYDLSLKFIIGLNAVMTFLFWLGRQQIIDFMILVMLTNPSINARKRGGENFGGGTAMNRRIDLLSR